MAAGSIVFPSEANHCRVVWLQVEGQAAARPSQSCTLIQDRTGLRPRYHWPANESPRTCASTSNAPAVTGTPADIRTMAAMRTRVRSLATLLSFMIKHQWTVVTRQARWAANLVRKRRCTCYRSLRQRRWGLTAAANAVTNVLNPHIPAVRLLLFRRSAHLSCGKSNPAKFA